jgi:hypothetical protein
MSYYYFAASLPSLKIDGALPMSVADFQDMCQAHLAPRHRCAMQALLSDETEATHPFVRAWRTLDAQIRNAVARYRATKRRIEPATVVRQGIPFEGLAEKAVTDAFALTDPLQRELAIDRFRWDQLGSLAGFDMFSLESILAYGLRLKIVERWAALSEERGRTRAEDLIEQRSKSDA